MPTSNLRSALIFLALISPLSCSSGVPSVADNIHTLTELMQERLDIQNEVAIIKWNSKSSIDDPIQAQKVLAQVATMAQQAGLNPQLAQRFFIAQMDAGKLVQYRSFEKWHDENQGPFRITPYISQIRDALAKLSPELINTLAALQTNIAQAETRQAIRIAVQQAFPDGGVVNAQVRTALLEFLCSPQ